MERILLVQNATHPNNASLHFACKIAAMTSSRLTGLFIENLYYTYIPAGTIDNPAYFAVEDTATVEKADIEQTIRIFNDTCARYAINADTSTDKGMPAEEVILESRFADLVIIDPAINFYNREEAIPSDFLKAILTNAECPVMLAPEEYDHLDEIIFCYDGSASSVFAIKQFTYLFPRLSGKKAMLLEVKHAAGLEFSETDSKMMEWLRLHYSHVYYNALKGDVEDELFAFLFLKKNMFVVMGAYGRSMFSKFFHKSHADLLIRAVDLPLFITHH